MKRAYILIPVGVAFIVLFFVRNDKSRLSEEVFEKEEASFYEPQEEAKEPETDEYPEGVVADDTILDPLPVGPTQFKNGALEIFIEFEDSSLSAEQIYRISQDLNGAFSHLSTRLVKHGDQKKLAFEGKGRNWPDVLGPVRILQSSNGRDFLYINKSVSDAYKEAFDFIERKGIKETEVADLLDDLASGEFSVADIAVLSLQSVPVEKLNEVLEEMSKGRIKQPSVLAYRKLPAQSSGAVFAETLFLEFNDDIVTYAEVVGVVRIEGEWKIAL